MEQTLYTAVVQTPDGQQQQVYYYHPSPQGLVQQVPVGAC